MKRVLWAFVCTAFVLPAGCQTGSATGSGNDPNKPKKLTVVSPGHQTVHQDGTDEFTVRIDRDHFGGPVEIDVRNLPPGVSLVTTDKTIPGDKNTVKISVKADAGTKEVKNHKVTIAAKARDEKDMKEATVDFEMDVAAKRK